LSEATTLWLEQQEWKGNVRELENSIERAVVLTDRDALEPGDFRVVPPLRSVERGSGGEAGRLNDVVEAAETQAISDALKAVDGNRREAAKKLGVSLRTLFYKMSRYGLE
jgi:DNA-binding NtrC family response regulator